jgi:glycosyltransferase involved in cell wall biosynthesis
MLAQAVGSVMAQTLLPDAHHIAYDIEKQGAAATRQRALMAASTDFVAFLDSDDVFFAKHLEWLMQHQQLTGADFCYSWFKIIQQFSDGSTKLLEEDTVFPVTHYLNPFDPTDPIETTITVLVRTELAKEVGFKELDRGHDQNSGEDRYFTMGCLAAGAKISHLVRKSWGWRHHALPTGGIGNSSGRPHKGDAAL